MILGTGIGGIETIEQQQVRGEKHGFDRVNPFFIPRAISNMSAGHVALRFGLRGVCETTVSACASSANAIGEAYLKVKEGRADICLTGGSEAAVTPLSTADSPPFRRSLFRRIRRGPPSPSTRSAMAL